MDYVSTDLTSLTGKLSPGVRPFHIVLASVVDIMVVMHFAKNENDNGYELYSDDVLILLDVEPPSALGLDSDNMNKLLDTFSQRGTTSSSAVQRAVDFGFGLPNEDFQRTSGAFTLNLDQNLGFSDYSFAGLITGTPKNYEALQTIC